MESINNRRTIRKYKQEDISASLLNDLLEKAFRASTMGNMQLYSVIVTRDKQMKERLAPAHFNQPMVTGAPVVLTFCADFNRFSKWCRERKAVPGYDNPISFLNAATDALLVTQNFCTLAEENGLGICFLGTTIYNPDQIIDILQLPELVMPVATITVGYPDECPPQVDPENHHFIKENHKETLAQVFTEVRYKKSDNECMSVTLKETLKKQGFEK